MLSDAKDFRPMIGHEALYLVNKLGKVKALDRKINYRGKEIVLRQNPPEISIVGKTTYVLIRNKDFKNRRVNLTNMIRNIFGRQKQVVVKQPYVYCPELPKIVKPTNFRGRLGIQVEQWLDGKCIKVFETFVLAAESVNGEPRHISDAAYGKRSFYAGYQWKLKQ